MKIFKFGIRLWITITSILTFIVGWVMLAHAPKPSQPGSSTQAIAPPLPTLEPLPSLFQENGKSVQNNELQNHAMNTTVLLAAEGERAIDGMQATKIFIDECEQRFSRFLPASEITELNRFSGEWLKVSGDLMEMLELAQKYFEETQGIFDPSILPDLKHAGYDRSMDIIRANGVENDLPAPKQISRPAFSRMSLDPDGNQVRLLHGMEIDLGGIAKGWIVKQAARLLHRYSEVCGVSAGGDILFLGQPEDGLGWDVYLEDPRDPAQMLAQLQYSIGSGGNFLSHKTKLAASLIDPRTGKPAQTQWLSVTAVCSDIIAADVFAKTILIGGDGVAENLIVSNPNLTFIAGDPQGNLVGSPNFKEFIYEPASNLFLSSDAAR